LLTDKNGRAEQGGGQNRKRQACAYEYWKSAACETSLENLYSSNGAD
jgi:hypothetical protein